MTRKPAEDLPEPNQGDSGYHGVGGWAFDNRLAKPPVFPNDHARRFLQQSLLWLVASLLTALVIGLLSGSVPTRFRLLGLLAVAQGGVAGAVFGRLAISLKMHSLRVGRLGAFAGGMASVAVTSILWWQAWAAQMTQPKSPRPDAVMAAQMLAQMSKPDDGDVEQLQAYEETRRQLRNFLATASAPAEAGFDDWLAYRATALSGGRIAGTAIGLAELLLAGIASAWLVGQTVSTPFCLDCQNWRRVIRLHRFLPPLPETLKMMIPEPDWESTEALTVELAGCGCDARPTVNLKPETSGQKSRTLSSVKLTDAQFIELKRLLDEAQGMK